jgi:hypothetical protein
MAKQITRQEAKQQETFRADLAAHPVEGFGTLFHLARKGILGRKVQVMNAKAIWVPYLIYGRVEVASVLPDDSLCSLIDIRKHCENLSPQDLRQLVEVTASYSAAVSDALYQLDYAGVKRDPLQKPAIIASWQAYGRSYIIDFANRVKDFTPTKPNCLLLPCSKTRPYSYRNIVAPEVADPSFHKVVVTSLGVVPEEFWGDPVVLSYNTGVPDIWRVFKLARDYLRRANYDVIHSYLDYAVYVEVVRALEPVLGITVEQKATATYGEYGTMHFSIP